MNAGGIGELLGGSLLVVAAAALVATVGARRIPFASHHAPWLRVLRALAALSVLVAVARQLTVVYDQPDPAPVNFFSFFTIQANLIAAAVWAWGAARPGAIAARPAVRGAATLYLGITGVIYLVLSWGVDTDQLLAYTAPWVNSLMHQVLPLAIFLDWILAPPERSISRQVALRWLLYPIAFFAYAMVRGYLSKWYPYPFLQPSYWGGYSGVLLNAVIVLGMMLPIVFLVRWLGNGRHDARAALQRPAG